MVDNYDVNKPKFLEYMQIESLDKMPKSKYSKAINAIKLKAKNMGA